MNSDTNAVHSRTRGAAHAFNAGYHQADHIEAAHQAERVVAAEYYRADVDGLRGIAVLAVIGFHAFPDYFPGGFIGVDVFFVISGFLISSIILRQLRRSTFTLSDFYARRIRRIFPALVVVLAACLLFGAFALLPDELEQLGKHVGAASTFVSNVVFWREAGYFDRAAEFKPLLHLWSLAIEEQFYLGWPLLVLVLLKRRHNILLTVLMLTLASFGLGIAVGHEHPAAHFYLPFTRFWELGLGCLLAISKESPHATQRRFADARIGPGGTTQLISCARSLLPVAGVVLIAAAIFLFDRQTPFPGWAALVPTAGAMCVIAAHEGSWFQRRILACAALVFIGVISYPLYLWHWPLLSFATILESEVPASTTRITAVLLSVALAWLTFAFLERPIRARRSTRAAFALAGALAALGALGVTTYTAAGFQQHFDLDVREIRPEARTNALCLRNFPTPRDFNYCKSTSAERPTTVFLGDSRAQGVYDGVVDLVGAHHAFTLLGRGGCPPLLNVELQGSPENGCSRVWNEFVKYVEDVKPAVVVVVGGGSSVLGNADLKLHAPGAKHLSAEETFKHGVRELIAALNRTSRVVYVRELPVFESSPACFLRRVKVPWRHCSPNIARTALERARASYDRILDELSEEVPNLQLVDPIDTLCTATVCSQKLRSGEIIYSDQLHLSPAGGRYFAHRSGLPSLVTSEFAFRPD